MRWTVPFHDAFERAFAELDDELGDELLAHVDVLAEFGPSHGRPQVYTLAGSRHANRM